MQTSTPEQIRSIVREADGAVASQRQQSGCCGGGTSCCGPSGTASTRLGYTEADLAACPMAPTGLGCGNPQAIAGLKPGERVLDLGSGGGILTLPRRPIMTPTPTTPITGQSPPDACCDSTLLSTCCLPHSKAACCGPSPRPTTCGCRSNTSPTR